MPESPDFKQLARRFLVLDGLEIGDSLDRFALELAEQLRQVWNARGAADVVQLEELSIMMGAVTAGPYVKNLDRAIRRLDR